MHHGKRSSRQRPRREFESNISWYFVTIGPVNGAVEIMTGIAACFCGLSDAAR
jgi:hypothetical protein